MSRIMLRNMYMYIGTVSQCKRSMLQVLKELYIYSFVEFCITQYSSFVK